MSDTDKITQDKITQNAHSMAMEMSEEIKMSDMDKITKNTHSMAMESLVISPKWIRWKYRIKDNPYSGHKKNAVIWHNAFYDKCRELGRNI